MSAPSVTDRLVCCAVPAVPPTECPTGPTPDPANEGKWNTCLNTNIGDPCASTCKWGPTNSSVPTATCVLVEYQYPIVTAWTTTGACYRELLAGTLVLSTNNWDTLLEPCLEQCIVVRTAYGPCIRQHNPCIWLSRLVSGAARVSSGVGSALLRISALLHTSQKVPQSHV
jgi:hypothetical protein